MRCLTRQKEGIAAESASVMKSSLSERSMRGVNQLVDSVNLIHLVGQPGAAAPHARQESNNNRIIQILQHYL
jgi:hypothetical protein